MSHQILTKIRRACYNYSLISENDRIAIGYSGGKDSMVLVSCLEEIRKYYHLPFTLVVIHLDLGFGKQDFNSVFKHFQNRSIEFKVIPTKINDILQKNLTNSAKLPCSLCSKFKKALMISAAKDYGCNKVAFAHHGDDAIETFFLNAIYGGKAAVFQPKMYMSKTDMTFIRPLIYVREAEINQYCQALQLPLIPSNCPNDGFTKRAEIKNLLSSIYQQYPQAYQNFLIMLENQTNINLWKKEN